MDNFKTVMNLDIVEIVAAQFFLLTPHQVTLFLACFTSTDSHFIQCKCQKMIMLDHYH